MDSPLKQRFRSLLDARVRAQNGEQLKSLRTEIDKMWRDNANEEARGSFMEAQAEFDAEYSPKAQPPTGFAINPPPKGAA